MWFVLRYGNTDYYSPCLRSQEERGLDLTKWCRGMRDELLVEFVCSVIFHTLHMETYSPHMFTVHLYCNFTGSLHTTSTAWVRPGGTILPLLLSLRFLAFLQLKDLMIWSRRPTPDSSFCGCELELLTVNWAAIQNRLFTEWNELLDCYITLDST